MSIGVVNQGVGKRLDQQLFSPYNMQHNVKCTCDENNNNNQLAVDVQYSIVARHSVSFYPKTLKVPLQRNFRILFYSPKRAYNGELYFVKS